VVNAAQEMGLLGLTFHPDYATNRRFFVYYTGGGPRVNVVSELTTSPGDPDRADPSTLRELLSIRDPDTNHNGGMIAFDQNGYLVIGTGDGGSGGDPWGHGQDQDALLAKLLRIDVDKPGATTPYGIPPENPFALGGGAPEILALGLRNPWRWSFDRETWDIYVGDVGQNRYEEVSVVSASELAGTNFGWNEREGMHCRLPTGGCQVDGLTDPVIEMQHFAPDLNCAVVGGEVYRGGCFPDLVGRYFFVDYCVGVVRSFRMNGGVVVDHVTHAETDVTRPTSLHGDAFGELFLTAASGRIYAVEVIPP
jgi:glucose/arabinose dehydrogenase